MLARAACNIQYRACAGYNLIDQAAQAVTFTSVVLEMIDRIVKLGAIHEYAGAWHGICSRSGSNAEILLDSARRCVDAIHPEYEPGRVGVRDAFAANVCGKSGQTIERNPEWLRAREFRRQTGEEVGQHAER